MRGDQATGLTSVRSAPLKDSPLGHRGNRNGPVLGIVSGKGGVGKSALAINIATAAAQTGARVLLIDGDLGLANTDLLMGMVPACDLEDWCEGRARLSNTICRGPSGLQVLVSGSGRSVADRIRGAVSGTHADALRDLIDAQDMTILDLGAGIGDRVLSLAAACDLVWLVVTPEPTSLADAYATTKKLWQWSPRQRVELVINRVRNVAAGQRTHQAIGRLTQRFLSRAMPLRAVLPEDEAMVRSVARQSPLVLDEPNSPAARRLRLMAESLLEEHSAKSAGRDAGAPAASFLSSFSS